VQTLTALRWKCKLLIYRIHHSVSAISIWDVSLDRKTENRPTILNDIRDRLADMLVGGVADEMKIFGMIGFK
jgi:hypothetical protein